MRLLSVHSVCSSDGLAKSTSLIIPIVRNKRLSGTRNKPSYLIYDDVPKYDQITKILIAAVPGAFFVAGIIVFFSGIVAGRGLFIDTLVFVLIFYFILPRRYQVYNTKLRIALGSPLHWDIPLSTIGQARPARSSTRWAYGGVRLAMSSGTLVEIVRKKGTNVILSPSNREIFLERLNSALKAQQDT